MKAPRKPFERVVLRKRPLTGAGEDRNMANVYVEARPKRRPEGSPIVRYVVEDRVDSVLGSFKTQAEAIEWATKHEHHPLVARVRHLNDKKNPDHWRAA
jgi:hypothetical protein